MLHLVFTGKKTTKKIDGRTGGGNVRHGKRPACAAIRLTATFSVVHRPDSLCFCFSFFFLFCFSFRSNPFPNPAAGAVKGGERNTRCFDKEKIQKIRGKKKNPTDDSNIFFFEGPGDDSRRVIISAVSRVGSFFFLQQEQIKREREREREMGHSSSSEMKKSSADRRISLKYGTLMVTFNLT